MENNFQVFLNNFKKIVKDIYSEDYIPLHRPVFIGNEVEYLQKCIESNFVSSSGKEITLFENKLADFVGAKYAVAVVNGTSALHLSLLASDVNQNCEVITQGLSFVATANAIMYCGADPVFIDVESSTGTLCPNALENFINKYCKKIDGGILNKLTGKQVKACVPMHTFGHPSNISKLTEICEYYNIILIEDAAEALGSKYKDKKIGGISHLSAFSFNGNKILTTGGGGAITTNDITIRDRIRHLSTTAKKQHPYFYHHDELGFNYRMPNLNACLGLAQIEKLPNFLEEKRSVAETYRDFFEESNYHFWEEDTLSRSNYWLNAVTFDSNEHRDQFLDYTNNNNIMTRPIWDILSTLPHLKKYQNDGLKTAKKIQNLTVNIPSSVP